MRHCDSDLSLEFSMHAAYIHTYMAHAVRACVCMFACECECVFSPIKYQSGIWTICADRSDRSFCGTYKYVPHSLNTLHSSLALPKRVCERGRALALMFHCRNVLCYCFHFVSAKRAHFSTVCVRVCVCMKIHLSFCCAAAAVAVAALVYVFTIKRTEVEHADEREGALPARVCASRTERKQNIKFKGKLLLCKRRTRQRASRRRCCSLLRWLVCAASASVAVSFVSSQQHFSVAFLVLVVVVVAAAASELCAA